MPAYSRRLIFIVALLALNDALSSPEPARPPLPISVGEAREKPSFSTNPNT
jgi:hypothetical protein